MTYTVKQGDTLQKISKNFYGDPGQYMKIYRANPQIKDPDLIYPGQVFVIPGLEIAESFPTTIESDDIVCIIDDKEFIFWPEFSINFSIDTFDTFTMSAPFDPELDVYRGSFRPFSYKTILIYLDGELILNGVLINTPANINQKTNTVQISGYSKPGILNDCSFPISSYPLEFAGLTLQEIANIIGGIFGIGVSFEGDAGSAFEKVAPDPQETPLDFLIKLAKQRNLIISNTLDGKLLFRNQISEVPIASIKQDETPFISCVPSFDPQNFFSHITGLSGVKEDLDSNSYTVENSYLINLGIQRPHTFIIDDVGGNSLEDVVKAKAGRMLGSSVTYGLNMWGHRSKDGDLYTDNKMISLSAPGAQIYTETNLIIKESVLNRAPKSGDTVTLTLALPGSYTGVIPGGFPWEE